MGKGAIAKTIAEEFTLKQNVAGQIISSLSDLAAKEVKTTGKFVFPGFCMVKTRVKPATKACEREIFGKLTQVKAKPARTIVKAFPRVRFEEEHLRLLSSSHLSVYSW